jgi:hypothetical protein
MTSQPSKTPKRAAAKREVSQTGRSRVTGAGDRTALNDDDLDRVSGGSEPTKHPTTVTVPS